MAKSIYCGSIFDILECFTGLDCLTAQTCSQLNIAYLIVEFTTIFDSSCCEYVWIELILLKLKTENTIAK